MNQGGSLTREEPYSFWVQPTNSATPVYGAAANQKPVDAILITVAGAFTMTDQAGNSLAFPATIPVGTILQLSPANISAGAAGVFLLYK